MSWPLRPALTLAVATLISACSSTSAPPAGNVTDPTPQSVSEFQEAASRVLQETGVPGAGIALVRQDGVEWEGGAGYADRDQRTPVTADTHFRVGSVSKTFVAMGLVQLTEEGLLDLDDAVQDIAPEIAIENPWQSTDPVTVLNLLQHTAGFDDMHFNERYVPDGEAERPLEDVLRLNPRSRRVRWRPGERMAYSNPGYAVAGYLLEKLAAEPYENFIQREIFEPLQMSTSSFRLTAEQESLLARGYDGPTGPPVGYPRIYLRPAGNMHSSAREMARFVRMLLGWGELGTAFVVDPEYLGNMELPRSTLAASAGLRHGYGSGIASNLQLPYPMLGHGGGINGFLSLYAYSPSRDVGFVILLNSTGDRASEAMNRLSSLATRYLKRDVEPPAKPEMRLDAATLDRYTGYYHDANPRNQFAWPVQNLLSGCTIVGVGERLEIRPVFDSPVQLIAVSETTFRLPTELVASRVFTTDRDGRMIMAGPMVYSQRQPRWRIEIVRIPVAAALLIVGSVVGAALAWLVRLRRARPRGFWGLKLIVLACPLTFLAMMIALVATPGGDWGTRNAGTITVYLATLAIPLLALLVPAVALVARRGGASRWLTRYALVVAAAMAGLALYLRSYEVLGLRMWSY